MTRTPLDDLIFEHGSTLALLVDPATLAIQAVSPSTLRALGYGQGALVGAPVTLLEDSMQDVFYWDEVRGGQQVDLDSQETDYRRADGHVLRVSRTVRRIAWQDRAMVLVEALPARGRQAAEALQEQMLSQLGATLEATDSGILVVDGRGQIERMNHLFGTMWAVPDVLVEGHDGPGILAHVLARVREPEMLRERLAGVLAPGETRDPLHHEDGRVFELGTRPLFMGGRIFGRVFAFHDISQRVRIEAELRESHDLLEQRVRARTADLQALNETLTAEKQHQAVLIQRLEEAQNQLLQSERMASIGQLAAGVAHEINNPVGFVKSNFGTLQRYAADLDRLLALYESLEASLPEAARGQVRALKRDIDLDFLREDMGVLFEESHDGLQRVARIVQDLKNFSHASEGEQSLADLEAGLESTLRVVWNELKYKSSVVKEYAGLPSIRCDPFQLNQVFMNLLVNASHAIDDQGTITLRTGYDEQQVWVEVQDTGHGIRPEHLSHIFEPFFTTKPVGKGTGLGLSVSYGIVQKHHGQILVQSEVGQGTVFRVVLPREPAAAEPHPEAVAQPGHARTQYPASP